MEYHGKSMDPMMNTGVTDGNDEAPKTGTTIVAAVYDGGVVLGADTRVSTG